MTYEIKIVPDLCCMETSERVLTTGVESFQNTAMKTGSFLLRWHNFPLKWRHRGQEDPAAARIHGKPFRKKEEKEKKQHEVQTLCQSPRHCAASTGFLQSCRQEKARKRSVSEKKKNMYVHTKPRPPSTRRLSADSTHPHVHIWPESMLPVHLSTRIDKTTTFTLHPLTEPKDGTSLSSYSSHSCSIWLVCVLCCSKRFHYGRLELQQFFFYWQDKCVLQLC